MNRELLTDLGENYEYVRTIVANKLELLKIDVADKAGKLVGGLIVALLIGVLGLIIAITILIIIGILLAKMLGSTLYAIAIIMLFCLLLSAIIWFFRKKLVMAPIASMIFELILNDEND